MSKYTSATASECDEYVSGASANGWRVYHPTVFTAEDDTLLVASMNGDLYRPFFHDLAVHPNGKLTGLNKSDRATFLASIALQTPPAIAPDATSYLEIVKFRPKDERIIVPLVCEFDLPSTDPHLAGLKEIRNRRGERTFQGWLPFDDAIALCDSYKEVTAIGDLKEDKKPISHSAYEILNAYFELHTELVQ